MSERIHTADAANVSILEYTEEELVRRFGEEYTDAGSCIVIEDRGNQEIWIMLGKPTDIGQVMLRGAEASNAILKGWLKAATSHPALRLVSDDA